MDAPGESSARAELARVGVDRFTASDYRPGTVTHIVLFRFAESTTTDDIAEATSRFLALAFSPRGGIPYIRSIVAGSQRSSEDAGHGFEQGFIVTFESLGDRNFYSGRPIVDDLTYFDANHDAFKSFVGPLLADVLVFDLQQ
jgi:hypothetical protein